MLLVVHVIDKLSLIAPPLLQVEYNIDMGDDIIIIVNKRQFPHLLESINNNSQFVQGTRSYT